MLNKVILNAMIVLVTFISTAHSATITATPVSNNPIANVVSSPPMNSAELIAITIAGIGQECLDYCVTGISFYLAGCPACRVETTPRIAHNIPDFVVMAHPDIYESPWLEWNEIFGEAQKEVEGGLLLTLTNGLFNEVGGGQSQFKRFGQHQTHVFKETQLIGNPVTLITRLLGGDGAFLDPTAGSIFNRGCSVAGCLERDPVIGVSIGAENDATNGGINVNIDPAAIKQAAMGFLQNFGMGVVGYMAPELLQAFSYLQLIQQLRTIIDSLQAFRDMSQLGASQGVTLTAKRVMCPSDAYPFLPYYLSSMDSLFWRNGFPITDLNKATAILNPISSDKIGPLGPSGSTIERWGNIYPRQGTVDNPEDQHAAAVVATRAADIMNDGSAIHVKWPVPTQAVGKWQPIYPEAAACKTYIEDGPVSDNAGYAWNLWRRYQCDMSESGHHLATVYFPQPICLPGL